MTTHQLDDRHPHVYGDTALTPRLRIKPGDIVIFETQEASSNQVTPQSTSDVLADLNFVLPYPLTGPVYVEGAEPGNVLSVEVLELKHKGWGWNGVIPSFGLLHDDFANPYLHLYKLVRNRCIFRQDIVIPYEPFCGTMSVAPTEPTAFHTILPRKNSGNLEIRHLTPGVRVFLPIMVEGAFFACGNCRAAQGDGEVNGTGIEAPMTVTLRFELFKGMNLPEIRFVTPPRKKLTVADQRGYYATTAQGPDLLRNAKQAVRSMLDYLAEEHNMTRAQAYCLCGAALDLKISEIANTPNRIVSAYLPLSIFGKGRTELKANSKQIQRKG